MKGQRAAMLGHLARVADQGPQPALEREHGRGAEDEERNHHLERPGRVASSNMQPNTEPTTAAGTRGQQIDRFRANAARSDRPPNTLAR